MKTRDFLWGLLMCASFSACSSDDVVKDDVLTGGDSYVSIRLVTSNGDLDSRGSAGNPEFTLGTTEEATVTNSHFYFYDSNGNFVVEGETVSSIADSYPNQSLGNEETKGTVNVVLKNVQALPSSVLVVLNMDKTIADEQFKTSLTGSYAALANSEGGYGYNKTESDKTVTYFTMTNSTYVDGTKVICATPLTTNNLQASAELAKQNPVTIHIERMAAKVNVGKATSFEASATATTQTGEATSSTPNQTLSISIDAWGLNGVNKSSYYMKKIDNTWNYGWWQPTENYYRTYWAMDPNYATGDYPTSAENHNNGDKEWALKYFTANEINENYKDNTPQYCLENTLGESLLSNNQHMTAATHVIVLATMKIGENSTVADLFNYKGVIYDEDNYKKVALADLTASYSIFEQTTANEKTTYTEIAETDIEVKSLTDGKVTIGLTTDAGSKAWYNGSTNEATSISDMSTIFASLNEAEGYKNGKMYYTIPIEHLGRSQVTSPYQVGDYGVVRNHFYNITINKIENLGKGIYNMDEVIVPNYDPEKYYVAAELHILSWKNVNQNVDL